MTEPLREVALASSSPRRLQLLESLGLRVTVVASGYEENGGAPAMPGCDLALRHALGKARSAPSAGPRLLVAADTVVDVGGALLGKPRDDADAARMLRSLAGRWHTVHTGFAVADRRSGETTADVESARVKFVPLDDAVIARYVASGEPRDKAGAYGIQGLGALLVERVDGDFYTVMGLPLARLGAVWRGLGFEMP